MAMHPKYYKPQPGDVFLQVKDLRPEHRHRVFEARNQRDGTGILGNIEDANHYLLDGVVGLRFYGEPLGMFLRPGDVLLLKPEGYVIPGTTEGNPPT